jgi:ankyrin repeat protein
VSGSFQLLAKAIIEDDRDRIKLLLQNDAKLANATASEARLETVIPHWIYVGDSALHVATAGYRVEIAKLLLDAGADCAAAENHRRSQPIHYAADGNLENAAGNAQRQVQMIEILIKAGADIHARDKNGATPLHRAVRTRCADAVKFLLDAGADATLRNKPGSTPFHLAVQNTGRGGSGAENARNAQRQIIETFLDRGVSPKLKDARGKTVLDWTKSEWIRQILSRKPEAR